MVTSLWLGLRRLGWFTRLFVTLSAAYGILLLPLPVLAQSLAAWCVVTLLPGWLCVELLWSQPAAPPWWERLLYGVGVGYALTTLSLLLLSYLPGGVAGWQVLSLMTTQSLIYAIGLWWRQRQAGPRQVSNQAGGPQPWTLISLALLIGVAGLLRFYHLGYSEFLTDEARVVLRAAAVLQGYEDVLFLHRKGPVEILLPAALYAVVGAINEATARLPFALANLAALLVLYRLGWQLFGPFAGWVAALFLAVDGYLIAFSRFVQYQSIVLLTTLLAVLLCLRLHRESKQLWPQLLVLVMLVATGLLAHYDGVFVFLPVAIVWIALIRQRRFSYRQIAWGLAGAGVIGLLWVALFYWPFVRNAHFQATLTYLLDQRLGAGGALPYNNLADITQRTIVYNSLASVLVHIILLTYAFVQTFRRGLGGVLSEYLGATLLGLALFSMWLNEWLPDAPIAFVLSVSGFLLLWAAPRLNLAERLLWLWFGLPLLVTLFLVAAPGTHIYVGFPAAALLSGGAFQLLWQKITRWGGTVRATWLLAAPASALTLAIIAYVYFFFAYTRVEALRILQNRTEEDQASVWLPPERFAIDRLYGFPLSNGWKVVGQLYANGVIEGAFETNQRGDLVSDWYTRGQYDCASLANWYFAVNDLEYWTENRQELHDDLREQGFAPWGVVEVNNMHRMMIYHRSADQPAETPLRYFRLEEYAPTFDHTASATFPLIYPAVEEPIKHPLHLNFNNEIWLEGYTLLTAGPFRPGESLRLTLYWRAQRSLPVSYKVFTQAYYGDGIMIAQKDSFPGCDRTPTTFWYPGEIVADTYDIPIAADAPNGDYPLYVGLYHPETMTRLFVVDEDGQPYDDKAETLMITIRS